MVLAVDPAIGRVVPLAVPSTGAATQPDGVVVNPEAMGIESRSGVAGG